MNTVNLDDITIYSRNDPEGMLAPPMGPGDDLDYSSITGLEPITFSKL